MATPESASASEREAAPGRSPPAIDGLLPPSPARRRWPSSEPASKRQIAERRVLDRELEIGRRIQVSLMPRRFAEVPGWEIASAYEAAREVGGDSAGHDPVHVLRADGRLEVLDPPGRLIGMVDDIVATTIDLSLEPGDGWIGHPDGVTEARNPTGAFYGEERLRAVLAGLAGSSAGQIVAAITTDVASFRGAAEPSDDLTLQVVRRSRTAAGGDPG